MPVATPPIQSPPAQAVPADAAEPDQSGNEPAIDIAIFRRESGYSDLRHPDKVEPGDELCDSARRDFTVNALYFDPITFIVHDYVDGYRDIGLKVIRTVGNPQLRFEASPVVTVRIRLDRT